MKARQETAAHARTAPGGARARIISAVALIAGFQTALIEAQYSTPGVPALAPGAPSKDSFEKSIENSQWRLGLLHLSPWLGLRDASFVTTANESRSETDFTMTAGAGVRAYLPLSKVILTAHALPEYVWWQDNEAKRGLNGRFGAAVFAYFNRLTLEASHRIDREQSFFSAEIQELTTSRIERSKLSMEVDVAHRLSLFGTVERSDNSNEEEESPIFSSLDRDNEVFTFGLRYSSPGGWTLGLGYEDRSVGFAGGSRNLSNSGTAELLEIGYQRSRVGFRLAVAFRHDEADEGSDFGELDESTGTFDVLVQASRRLNLLAYLRRRQTYSVDELNAFVVEERQGARLDFGVGSSLLGLYAEIGEDDFAPISATGADRIDDVTALGANLQFVLRSYLTLTVRVLRAEYDSNLDELDRDVTTVGFDFRLSFGLGRVIEKLSLGSPEINW